MNESLLSGIHNCIKFGFQHTTKKSWRNTRSIMDKNDLQEKIA